MKRGKKILCIAHRGFSALYPENTFRAIEAAMLSQADGFECDLRMTKDGVVVLFHDDNLKRLCGLKSNIESNTWADLKKLNVFYREPICRIEQVLEAFPDAISNFEIKASPKDRQVVEALVLLFEKYPTTHRRMISSFSQKVLEHAMGLGLEKTCRLSPIFKSPYDSICKSIGSANWVYSWNLFYKEINSLRSQPPKPLWLWTPNDSSTWEECLSSSYSPQIEALISDHPDRLYQFLSSAH